MLTKAKITEIQAELSAAIKAVADKHNLSMSGTKIGYTDADFKLACTFADKSQTGDASPDAVRTLKRNGPMFGLHMSHLGQELDTPNGLGKFQGMRGNEKAIVAIPATGKSYLFPAAWVSKQLNK